MLKQLQAEPLPRFTILTGLNGSGKTALLKAIKDGQAQLDGVESDQIVYENAASFYVPDQQVFASEETFREIDATIERIYPVIDRFRTNIERHLGAGSAAGVDSIEDAIALFGTRKIPGEWMGIFDQVNEALQGDRGLRHFKDYRRLLGLSKGELKPALLVSNSDTLVASVNTIFALWRDAYDENRYNRYLNDIEKEANHVLTEPEFFSVYGPPPWKLFNDICHDLRFEFRIEAPPARRGLPYTPRLVRNRDGSILSFSSLSSGEKTLFRLVMMTYSGLLRRGQPMPGLLLLDEVDGHLHPSLANNFVQVMKGWVVREMGLSVIIATHSPSTVAFGEDEDVYTLMERDGTHYVSKSTRDLALKVLTSGVPTLSISYDGRRQVFCEDNSDCEIYSKLYDILKNRLQSERSLNFISTAVTKNPSKEGEGKLVYNGGRDKVAKVVEELASSGNTSTFGLVDWDAGKSSNTQDGGRVVILAEGARYSVENVLFDPLLIAALLIAEDQTKRLPAAQSLTTRRLPTASIPELQALVDDVVGVVLPARRSEQETRFVSYEGGFQLQVQKRYLEMNGHELASEIRIKIPELQRIASGNAGFEHELKRQVISKVAKPIPEFIPLEIRNAFEAILIFE